MTLALFQSVAKADVPITFGVFPYLGLQRLMHDFSPLRDYLQQTLGHPVNMVTAPSYSDFYDRTRDGSYDIVFTPPHFGIDAEKESRFERIARTGYQVSAVILVPTGSSIRKVTDLRGKTLAVPPKMALVNVLVLKMLRSNGIDPEKDLTIREFSTNQNAMAAPLRGDADAGSTGALIWTKEGQHDKLRPLAESAEVSGFFLMAHPRITRAKLLELQTAMRDFGSTPTGQRYLADTGHGGWLPIDDATMRHVRASIR